MSHAPAPNRPLPVLPRRIELASAPLPIPADGKEPCWMCGERWRPGLLTTGGAGPCCTLDVDDLGDAA